MKTINRINLAMFIAILMLSARISSAEVAGGYVNSAQEEYIVVFFDAVSAQKVLLGASLDSIKINNGAENVSGKLYIVQPDGRWAVSTKTYKDRTGVTVYPPTNKLDKVVYLGRDMNIRGGVGLSESEIAKIAVLKKSSSLARAVELVRPERQKALFEGVEHAARGALDAYRMDDAERAEIFNSTVGFTAGLVAQEMTAGIVKSADAGEDIPKNLISGREFVSADKAIIKGIGLVADDDNGGGGEGRVADDDNGGGGEGLVNDDDNGGGGEGFVSVVVSGWDADLESVDLPNARGLNANCAGTYLFLL
jgi:hypothetical protein